MHQLSIFGNMRSLSSAVLFAGGGGACEGIRRATGASPLFACNHDEHAIRVHQVNHPDTIHAQQDVFSLDPLTACRGRRLDLLWMSPDCTHFSPAKGAAPRDTGSRALADSIFPWIDAVRPKVIGLENVKEFLKWGPLDNEGKPIKARAREFFNAWLGKIQARGYRVEWRILDAHHYGVPTSRQRLYLVARCDGRPFVWPEPTHGPGLIPYRTAAEIIDWSIPCPSIFNREKPLKPKTERRLVNGLYRFVLEADDPFVLPDDIGVAYLTKFYGTATGSSMNEPVPTVTATGNHLGLVVAWIAKHYTGATGHRLDHPLSTVTATDHHSLCTAVSIPGDHGGGVKVAAFLQKYYGTGVGQSLRDPIDTIPCVDRFGLVTVMLEGYPRIITDIGMRMLQPRELANAMGFPPDYRLEGSKRKKVARIGNAVCPPMAEAIVRSMMGIN